MQQSASPVADAVPDWVELRGRAAARERLPGCTAKRDAFACPCEDVRLRDLEAAVASGLRDVELIKRRTGAMTGPCQGKVCQGAVLTALRDLGVEPRPMTPRPFARVTRSADLAVAHDA
ncbi:MAG: (2Fe-2S)-binding protein [Actinomycetota bacterium]